MIPHKRRNMTTQNKLTTVVSFLLDESGSMESIKEATIAGFNKYVKSLQKQKGKFLLTLTKFDSRGTRTPYIMTDVKKVEPLDDKTYQPGMSTPLYDSSVEMIERVANEIRDDQPSLVVIMTDGLENASTKHDAKCLTDLIKKLEQKGNWTFVFLGANQDSWAVASKMGFSFGNTLNWKATEVGTQNVFRGLAQDTACYAMSMTENVEKGVALNTSNFVKNTTGGEK